DDETRRPDRVLRAEDKHEATTIGGAGLQRAAELAPPADATRVDIDCAHEGVAEAATPGRDDRRQHPRRARPGGGEDQAMHLGREEIVIAKRAPPTADEET